MYALVDMSGKLVVVAGSSAGIGRQTAITLSRLGARLALVARNEDSLMTTLQELEGVGHSYYVSDLSEVDATELLVKSIVENQGSIDGLVYSVGKRMSVPLAQLKPEKIRTAFDANLFGFVEIVRQITRKGRFNPGASIVGVSSVAAFCGDSAHTAYSASKAAMDGAVRCMAKELAQKEVRVNTVAPAMTRTKMYDAFIAQYGEESDSHRDVLQRQYLGVADPQDIANAIAFLVSPAARFITGICLPVDGGYTSD